MTITRLNPIDVYQPPNGNLTQTVVATGSCHVHVAGTVAWDVERRLVGDGDLAAQVTAILDNLERSLAAGGATFADVVRMNIYTIDVDAYRTHGHGLVLERFPSGPPASTLLGVSRLADQRLLVEIDVTAVIGEHPTSAG